jgi:lathosterol oxidase
MMLPRLLGLPDNALVTWLTLTISGLLVYFTLSGLSYLVVYIVARRRFHPTYVADPPSDRKAMRLAAVGTLGNMALMTPIYALIGAGHSRIYWSVWERGVPWLVASAVLYIAFVDTVIYWSHRTMHTDFLYRHIHRYHHQWQVPNSWTSMAFHPLDSFVLAVPLHAFAFLVPLNGYLYFAMQGTMSLWSVASHDRVAIVRRRWFNYADNHTLHHWFYQCNFGQFFTFWDRIAGTWRDPVAETAAGNVPKGVLR